MNGRYSDHVTWNFIPPFYFTNDLIWWACLAPSPFKVPPKFTLPICKLHIAIFLGGYFANLSLPIYQLQFAKLWSLHCPMIKSMLPCLHSQGTKSTPLSQHCPIVKSNMYVSPTHLIHIAKATLPNCQAHMPYLHSQAIKSTLPKIAKYTSPFEPFE